MTRTNKIYGITLFIVIVVTLCAFNGFFVSKYFNKHRTSSVYSGTNESSLGIGGFYDTLDEVEEHIGLEPLKEYEANNNIYILVSKGLELFDERILCYKYDTITKRLYRVWGEYCSIDKHYNKDGDWYENEFVFNLMVAIAGDGHYIPQETEEADGIGDVFYGVWFGDEIKNISFEKGTFEYSFLGTEDGYNVYFWTYELRDSNNLLKEVVRKDDEKNHYYYYLEDVSSLLGIKCKMTIDKRIVAYWLIMLVLIALSSLVIIKTYVLNKHKGKMTIKALLWIVSVMLCFMVTLLIAYYINNPRLFFGTEGVNEFVKNLTGHSLPNAIH